MRYCKNSLCPNTFERPKGSTVAYCSDACRVAVKASRSTVCKADYPRQPCANRLCSKMFKPKSRREIYCSDVCYTRRNNRGLRKPNGYAQSQHWRAIPGYEGRYEISDRGDILSLVKGRRILNPSLRRHGRVAILSDRFGKQSWHLVHRLVMQVFRPLENDRAYQSKFINGDYDDIRLDNLEWVLKRNHATLTPGDVRTIRARLIADNTLTYETIGREYGVTFSAIGKIMAGTKWRDVA